MKTKKIRIPGKSNPPTITATTINALTPQTQNPIKRGRGRPRKYPKIESEPRYLRPPPRIVFRGPSADRQGLPKSPHLPMSWVGARKRSSILTPLPTERRSPPSVTESCSGSGSDCSPESELSWFAGIEIPGPIPNLDELLRDPDIVRASDFFADLPDFMDWDWL